MQHISNPFITSGYISAEYFCDREKEGECLINEVTNGNNLALISTRRMGKTGLIRHCFHTKKISKDYYTFFVDIYATKSLRDFIFSLSKVILEGLKPFGRKAVERFINNVKSLGAGISFDASGTPSFNLQFGDIHNSTATLDEIFRYLNEADKPCIVAIDEFQQITSYPEDNIEALLRTHIQHCNNAKFIFAGSQRHIMGNMFMSAARPFYQSVSVMHLDKIPLGDYTTFARRHFKKADKEITAECVEYIYDKFRGVTWYLQKVLNTLYSYTPQNTICDIPMVEQAVKSIVDSYKFTFQEIIFRIPEKQKDLLVAIAKEGVAYEVTSGRFVKQYRLPSPSSVQSALKGLLEKDFITKDFSSENNEGYMIYDQFFNIWIKETF